MNLDGTFVVAGTGSRELATNKRQATFLQRLADYVEGVKERHPNLVLMSGGAEGWDHAITLVAREQQIPYVLCLPNTTYLDYYWRRHSVTKTDRYQLAKEMAEGAAEIEYTAEDHYHTHGLQINGVHMNFLRNQRMVDLADAFLVYHPQSAGTADCVKRIIQAGKPMKEIR